MREINKTIYKILKMEEPDDGVNVSQLITDDLIAKAETGEAKAKAGATEMLDKKADLIHGKSSTVKKNLKATGGTRVGMKIPKEVSSGGAPTKKVVKKVVKKAGASGATPVKKKVVKKAGTKTNTKVVKKKVVSKSSAKEESKTNPLIFVVLALVLAGAGAYYYLEMM